MPNDFSPELLVDLERLQMQVDNLIKYVCDMFDRAPSIGRSAYLGCHVEDDSAFFDHRIRLIDKFRELLKTHWDGAELRRFEMKLESFPRTIALGCSPVWQNVARCRCWWDARDELQTIERYLGERALEVKSSGVLRGQVCYVDFDRIAELRAVSRKNKRRLDLTGLVALCEELNKCYANGCYISVSILLRAIIDHVYPAFGDFPNFAQAISQTGGSSFKNSMKRLDNVARKIADKYLHEKMQYKVALPNRTQVNFSQELDLLLQKVVEELKE